MFDVNHTCLSCLQFLQLVGLCCATPKHCAWDPCSHCQRLYVLFREPSARHLIADRHPVIVQVVLAPKDLQILTCTVQNN